jgi:hypothetical protein
MPGGVSSHPAREAGVEVEEVRESLDAVACGLVVGGRFAFAVCASDSPILRVLGAAVETIHI